MNDKGDVLLKSTTDGFEINIKDGIVEMTSGFETAVLLTLLGGNEKDDGTEATKKYEWWGNKLESNNPERKLTSRFQNILFGLPATPANLKKLEEAGKLDLQWFITEKITDTIEFIASLVSKNKVDVIAKLFKDKEKLSETRYSLNWGNVNVA